MADHAQVIHVLREDILREFEAEDERKSDDEAAHSDQSRHQNVVRHHLALLHRGSLCAADFVFRHARPTSVSSRVANAGIPSATEEVRVVF